MSDIKSIADQLRETINKENSGSTVQKVKTSNVNPALIKESKKNEVDESLSDLFEKIHNYRFDGTEKMPVRLDTRTVFMLKQLKIIQGIDMNKLIAFSVQDLLKRHPKLTTYIKEKIKTIEL